MGTSNIPQIVRKWVEIRKDSNFSTHPADLGLYVNIWVRLSWVNNSGQRLSDARDSKSFLVLVRLSPGRLKRGSAMLPCGFPLWTALDCQHPPVCARDYGDHMTGILSFRGHGA